MILQVTGGSVGSIVVASRLERAGWTRAKPDVTGHANRPLTAYVLVRGRFMLSVEGGQGRGRTADLPIFSGTLAAMAWGP